MVLDFLTGAIGNFWSWLRDKLSDTLGWLWAHVYNFFWPPLRPWLGTVWLTLRNASIYLDDIAPALAKMSVQVRHFFDNGKDYVAAWLVQSFWDWADAVLDLVEDYIDRHWDD